MIISTLTTTILINVDFVEKKTITLCIKKGKREKNTVVVYRGKRSASRRFYISIILLSLF